MKFRLAYRYLLFVGVGDDAAFLCSDILDVMLFALRSASYVLSQAQICVDRNLLRDHEGSGGPAFKLLDLTHTLLEMSEGCLKILHFILLWGGISWIWMISGWGIRMRARSTCLA